MNQAKRDLLRAMRPTPEVRDGEPEMGPRPLTPIDGLRITLSAVPDQFTCITPHGLEVELPLNIEGLIKLRSMLLAQSQSKLVPPLGLTPVYIWAEWERIGPTGAGKLPKASHKPTTPATVDPNLGL